MELMTLDSEFQPDRLVENYESLIWAERYSSTGDFELHSTDIPNTLRLLPRESYVTLRDSTVPMIVENYKISKALRQAPKIVVTGRSFESVLERRASVRKLQSSYMDDPKTPWEVVADKESDAAYIAMRTVLGDFPRYKDDVQVLPMVPPAVSPLDAIDEIDLILPADFVPLGETATEPKYEIKPDNLYTTVMQLLAANRRGLKSVRPGPNSSKVGIEIYNGANLTGEGSTADPDFVVVLDARFDQLDSATYLLSQRGSASVSYVYGSAGATMVMKNTGPEPSGLNRRVILQDLSGDAAINSEEVMVSRGLIELYKYNATVLFDGQVAEQVANGYGKTYHLGDIVKLVGEFGMSQNVRVSEFIRTSDATGEKAYPTFEAVDD